MTIVPALLAQTNSACNEAVLHPNQTEDLGAVDNPQRARPASA